LKFPVARGEGGLGTKPHIGEGGRAKEGEGERG